MSKKEVKTVSEHHRQLADNLKKDMSFTGTGMKQSDKMISNNLPDGLNMGHFNLTCEYQKDLAVALPLASCEAMVDEMVKDQNLDVLTSSFDIGYTAVESVVRRDGKVVTPEDKANGIPAKVEDVKGKVTFGISHASEDLTAVRKTVMSYANQAFKTK